MQYYSGYFLSKYTDLVGYEISGKKLGANSVYDVLGVDIEKKNTWAVEVKKSKKDFKRDEKLLVDSGTYLEQVNFCYLCCPANVIQLDQVPAPIGLIYFYKDMIPVKYIKRDSENREIINREYIHIPKTKYRKLKSTNNWNQEAENRFSRVENGFEYSYVIKNIFSVNGMKDIDDITQPVIKVIKEATYMENSITQDLSDVILLTKRIGNKLSKQFIEKTVDIDTIECYNRDDELSL